MLACMLSLRRRSRVVSHHGNKCRAVSRVASKLASKLFSQATIKARAEATPAIRRGSLEALSLCPQKKPPAGGALKPSSRRNKNRPPAG
eukprot:864882-Pelagomonas_calceolata.AAC.1